MSMADPHTALGRRKEVLFSTKLMSKSILTWNMLLTIPKFDSKRPNNAEIKNIVNITFYSSHLPM
jgi:hypothetical protein